MTLCHATKEHADNWRIYHKGTPILNNPVSIPMVVRRKTIHDSRMHSPMINHVSERFRTKLTHKHRITKENDTNENGKEQEDFYLCQFLQSPYHAKNTGNGKDDANHSRNNQPHQF